MKKTYGWVAVLSLGALIIALFSQHMLNMRPCAWCVFQRLLLIGITVFAAVGYFFSNSRFITIPSTLLFTSLALAGALAAWYQYSVAAQQFSCAQTFADKFMSSTGLDAALPWLFGIYATCMDARVDLLGIEYAIWALMLFIIIATIGMFALFNATRIK